MIRLFRLLVPIGVFLLMCGDLALMIASFCGAVYLDSGMDPVIFFVDELGGMRLSFIVGIIWLAIYFQGLYGNTRIGLVQLLHQLLMAIGIAMIGQATLGLLKTDWVLPRTVVFIGCLLSLISVFVSHFLFSRAMQLAVGARPLVFLGGSPAVFDIATHLSLHPEIGLKPVGFVDDERHAENPLLPQLGAGRNLLQVVDEVQPEWIAIGSYEQLRPWWADDLLELGFGGVRLEDAATLYEEVFGRICISYLEPATMFLTRVFQPSPRDLWVQSAYSFLIAVLSGIFLLPLALIVALILRIGSKGPVLERIECAGLHRKPFCLYRFRCQETTATGAFLRRYHLDGIPQLINVLTGDMVLVGPRAERVLFAERMSALVPYYRQRFEVKPGLVQWRGYDGPRSQRWNSLETIGFDLYYLKNFAPMLDFFILVNSVKNGLSKP